MTDYQEILTAFVAEIPPGERKDINVDTKHIVIECPFQRLNRFQKLTAWLFRIRVNISIMVWEKRYIGPSIAPPLVMTGVWEGKK